MKSALITGITGQDGRYLAEHLASLGYAVHGMVRGQRNPNADAVRREQPYVNLIAGDLSDPVSIARVLDRTAPDELYNLAAISFVQFSFEHPLLTADVSGVGTLRLLEAIRSAGSNTTRFYQASTSEMFGAAIESPQNETTPFHPRSPYGSAKVFAHHTTVNYRESYGIYGVGGILFNHESPRRGLEFVTRKITYHAAGVKLGRLNRVELGNLDAQRDWGFAGDYVKAMHLMLQQSEPRDYVIGTGEMHSVREFAEVAFAHVGLDWRQHVAIAETHKRPADVNTLCADSSLARKELNWKPTIGFEQLVAMMVDSDMSVWKANAN
ncbi:MAG TPA: GDP-mannose 4,6-dehydratase [Thermomicrobiales bacterium]|nr:GDP-mannose 4,6-dehydratase [Thermomicrobiales bacterium]